MDNVARLEADERAALFEETAARRRLANASIVEKDFWVCWTLRRLHTTPGLPRLLFKGGTSLSKCFGLIHRFSEDIDLGIEREGISGLHEMEEVQCLLKELDPASGTSRNAYGRAVEALKVKVREHVEGTFLPAVQASFRESLGGGFALNLLGSGDEDPTILFEYPRALSADYYGGDNYVQSVVRLELGARSDHHFARSISIRPYAAEAFSDQFEQPECTVMAQAPERTLLEKALIIHGAIHKGRVKRHSSRHAYDLAMMHRHADTIESVTRDLYERVAYHKFVYGENTVVRDAPQTGINLVPDGAVLDALESDYKEMTPMFFAEPAAPAFEEVLAELKKLQNVLRAL